ncbi:hypothetical protein [Streptomyces sp. NPDC058953]|uniref:hypothetical protein n=1 Tax=unclassified Streptomyces TaxID=2593676 RepID=UPI003687CC22
MSIAERAPDDTNTDYLHRVFDPTARAIEGLERAPSGLGLLDDALALDRRRPQEYSTASGAPPSAPPTWPARKTTSRASAPPNSMTMPKE